MVYRKAQTPTDSIRIVHLRAEGQARTLTWKTKPFPTDAPLPAPQIDVWAADVALGGSVELPEETRPMACPSCDGVGRLVCRACGGQGRREVTEPGRGGGHYGALGSKSPNVDRLAVCAVCEGGWTSCERCERNGTVIGTPVVASSRIEDAWHRVLDDPRISTDLFLALDEAAPRGDVAATLAWEHPAQESGGLLEQLEDAASRAAGELCGKLPPGRLTVELRVELIPIEVDEGSGAVRWGGRDWPTD